MQDEYLRSIIEELMFVVPHIGPSDDAVALAFRRLGVSVGRYPESFSELMWVIEQYILSQALPKSEYTIGGVSNRIESVMWNRVLVYSEFSGYKKFLNCVFNPLKRYGFEISYKVANRMWIAIGDKDLGFSYYSKRATLSLLNSRVMYKLSNDFSDGFLLTKEQLRDSIKKIVAFSTLKRNVLSRFCNF